MRAVLVLVLSLVLLGSDELLGSARAATDGAAVVPGTVFVLDETAGFGSDAMCVRCLGRRGAGGNRCLRRCHY